MQTLTFGGAHNRLQLPDSRTSRRLRAFRFLSKRYAQVERESDTAEFVLFGLIALIATWPLVGLVHAIGLVR